MNGLRERKSHIWPRGELDFYVEPEWCSERLFAVEKFEGPIHDPACGIGRIVRSAILAGHIASGSDVAERSVTRDFEHDYLTGEQLYYPNIVCNPPYRRAEQFVWMAMLGARKTAMFLPARFLFGNKRSRWLEATRPRRVWLLCPRPSVPPGEIIVAGKIPSGGKEDFCWLIYERDYDGNPEIRWLYRDV